MKLTRTASAELIKLATLPIVTATTLGTIATSIVLTAAIAASSTVPVSAVEVMVTTIPFLQIGLILVGVLSIATEYQSGQVRTSLTATPRRWGVLAGKSLAFLVAAVAVSSVAAGTGWLTATITLNIRQIAAASDDSPWTVGGATLYLVLIGSLAFVVSVLMRSLIPPLVTMLSLVLIVSPLIGSLTEHARWLPDKAGSLLYLTDTDTVLNTGTGALVLFGWITATGIAASTSFIRRDA